VTYRAVGAGALFAATSSIYGLGGIIAPFIGIKAIDLAITALGSRVRIFRNAEAIFDPPSSDRRPHGHHRPAYPLAMTGLAQALFPRRRMAA
jgi:hypothetical protein